MDRSIPTMPHDLSQTPAVSAVTPVTGAATAGLLAGVGETLYRTDTAGRVLWATGAVESLLGVPLEEFVGLGVAELYADPRDRDIFLQALDANAGVVTNYEARLRRRDGRLVWVSTNARFWRTPDGAVGGVEEITRDITEQKRIRLALEESEQRFRTLAETSGSIVFIYRDRFLYANPALESLLGYSQAELLEKCIYDVVHPDIRALVRERSKARLRGEVVPTRYELRVIDREGSDHWLEVSAGVVSFDGEPAGVATGFDITQRKRAEEALRQSEERFSKVFHADAAGIAISRRADGEFIDANDSFLRLCGYSREQLVGRTALELDMWPDPAQRERMLEELARQGSIREAELGLRASSGDEFAVLCSIEPIEIAGEPCLLYIGHDVTDRNQAQADLRQKTALLQLITAITACANEVRSLEDVLTTALDHICAHTGWPVGHAFLLDPRDQEHLRTSRIWHIDDAEAFAGFRATTESIAETSPGGLPGRVLAEHLPTWVVDVTRDPAFRRAEAARRCGLHSAFAFPILVGDMVAGVMEFFTTDTAEPDAALLDAMSHVGVQLGRAVERGRAEEALRRSEARYRRLVDHANDAIFIAQDGVIKFPNPRTEAMFGYTAEQLARRPFLELIAEADRALVADRHTRRLGGEQVPGTYAFRVIPRSGARIWVDLSTIVIEWEGRPATLNILRDVDAHKRAQDELFHEKERAQVTLQSIGDGVITTDPQGRVQYMNPAAMEITGWPQEAAFGKPLRRVLCLLEEVTRVPVDSPVDEALSAWCRVDTPGQVVLVRQDGRELAIEYSASPIRDRDSSVVGVIVVFRDVTEIRGMARQLSHQATHDSLTGLINRHEFENRLEHALDSARNEDKRHALCYLDLDQFKVVNDTCGHIAGDELLKQLGQHLHARVRDVDTLARLGGDEFGILLEGCPIGKAHEIADGLRQAIREFRFAWEDKSFEIGASIGVAPIDQDSGTKSEILSAADTACYVAKDLGRNRVHMYQPDDREMARRHGEMQWVSRISRGLEEDRFELFFQPIIDLRQPAGPRRGELLLRMRDPGGERVPPMAFIPAAERYNLMPALDRWVVRSAFGALGTGAGQLDSGLTQIMINLSGQSLSDDGFLDFVLGEIKHHGIDAGRICFEITETAAIANLGLAIDFIDRIKELGCQFALDDFGAGLSSFAYLKNLRVDYLKIYGHFVRDMVDDPIDYAMVEAINQVGHVLGIHTIAEFVETRPILEAAKELGIDYAQGFHLGKPAPLARN
jgi:diguanylate cyclase (GGDEF)-like protein/PAS domain S-box-containing protein